MGRTAVAALAAFLALSGAALPQEQPPEPPLPQPRPDNLGVPQAQAREDEEPARIYQTACPALLTGRVVGEIQTPLAERQCGLQSPVGLSALMVNGREIALPGSPVTNCAMAAALANWAEAVDAYARATRGTGIASLATGPGYQCRLRYGADAGFLSEHGRGNALDIVSVGFEDGSSVSVLDDWKRLPVEGDAKFLAFAHGAACARFTTVLGPEANEDHEDHFHFDLGCHGRNCAAVICE